MAGSAHAQRMAQRDRAAARVEPGIVVREPQFTRAREGLRGEGFVQFQNVDIVQLEAEAP